MLLMPSKLISFGINYRIITLSFLVLITCLTGLGFHDLRVDTSLNTLISVRDPDKQFYDSVVREFGSDNYIVIYIRDSSLWSVKKIAALEELHHALRKLDFVERVEDIFNIRNISGSGGEISVRTLFSEAPRNQEIIDQAKASALSNPFIVNNFLSRDGTSTALIVSVRDEINETAFDNRVNDSLERILKPAKSIFEIICQIGQSRINKEFKTILFADLKILGPLSALIFVATIFLILRSISAALVSLLTSGLSIAWTFGILGLVGIPINILSAMLPPLVIIIGSTMVTYMFSTYFYFVTQEGREDRASAVNLMMKRLTAPLIITIFTTAIGFASNIFSSIDLIQNFAIASAFAIFSNGIINILFVPMILTTLGPIRNRLFTDKEQISGLPGIFVKFFGFSKNHFPRSIILITILFCGLLFYNAYKLNVTNDPLSYFHQDQTLIQDINRIHRDLSGTKVFFITLESDVNKAFQKPENIEKLVTIQNFLQKQKIFDSFISLADHLSLINLAYHGGDKNFFKVPEKQELVAQYMLFLNRRDLESYVSHDFQRANIIVRHKVSDSNTLNRHIRELKKMVSHVASGNMKIFVTGKNLMINAAAESLLIAQVKSLIILIIVIFLIMSALFTSLKNGIISLFPSIISVILLFGVMGFLNIPLNPGTAMISVIVIGISLVGTIHLFSRYIDLCRRTSNYEDAVHKAITEEATPMVGTGLALAFGLTILLKSNFTIIVQFGALSAAAILFALFTNLIITPIIMSWTRLIGLHQILMLSMHKKICEKSPLFKGMSNYQIRKAILISELNEFAPGELLMEQGTIGYSMYLILEGKAEAVRKCDNNEQHLAFFGPGQILGEVGYVGVIKRTADVRALTHVEALRFNYKKIKKDLKFFPYIIAKLNFNISCILGERLADMMNVIDQGIPYMEDMIYNHDEGHHSS